MISVEGRPARIILPRETGPVLRREYTGRDCSWRRTSNCLLAADDE
jgi:hypothetical protein